MSFKIPIDIPESVHGMVKRKKEKDKQFLQNTTKKEILRSKKH
jgi:hypothetical protein